MDYLWLLGVGFPDGYITELDRARIPLHKMFSILSLVYCVYFLYAGWTASDNLIAGKLLLAASIYIALFGIIAFADYFLSLRLDHGIGG